MTTIQLHIPDILAKKLTKFGSDTERLIISSIREKVQVADKKLTLADEYKLATQDNQEIMKDFANIDMEGWEDEY
jgi:hypothetical protein